MPDTGNYAKTVAIRFFRDDDDIPNHPRWPMIIYPQVLSQEILNHAPGAFDGLFARNDWIVRFRAGIYPFVHYHSNAHEVLGLASGRATVRFGGDAGETLSVEAGDALLLPAGTGHQLIESSAALLVIGAYPSGPDRDLMRSGESDHDGIRARISAVPKPSTDPIGGNTGPMVDLWN